MSKFLSRLLAIACLLFTLITFDFTTTISHAQANDLVTGAGIFTANCAGCHLGGRNIIMVDKLNDEQIANVAAYILDKSEKGW